MIDLEKQLPKIKLCPVCNTAKLLEKHAYDDTISYSIYCKCGYADKTIINTIDYKKRTTPEKVIKIWNRDVTLYNLISKITRKELLK